MQLFSLGQGTVSPWNIVTGSLRVLLVLPTISDSSHASVPSLAVPAIRHCWIFGSTSNTLAWDSVEQCSVWTLSLVPRRKVALSGPTLTFPFVS